jgi:hypothetical protein
MSKAPLSEASQRERLARLDAHIRFEYELTAQRMTYLAISESFLFSTYIIALANFAQGEGSPLLSQVVSLVPWIGSALGSVVLAAVLGSISLTRKLRRERTELEESLNGAVLHRDLSDASLEVFLGHLPPVCVSSAFLIAWLIVWPS